MTNLKKTKIWCITKTHCYPNAYQIHRLGFGVSNCWSNFFSTLIKAEDEIKRRDSEVEKIIYKNLKGVK